MNKYLPYTLRGAITTSDATNITGGKARALYVGAAGNAVVVKPDGTTVTLNGLTAGSIYPIEYIRINATLTTAASLVALD